jgi:hypothetical protein
MFSMPSWFGMLYISDIKPLCPTSTLSMSMICSSGAVAVDFAEQSIWVLRNI